MIIRRDLSLKRQMNLLHTLHTAIQSSNTVCMLKRSDISKRVLCILSILQFLVILDPYVVDFNAAVAFTPSFDLQIKLWSTNVQNQENYVKKGNN